MHHGCLLTLLHLHRAACWTGPAVAGMPAQASCRRVHPGTGRDTAGLMCPMPATMPAEPCASCRGRSQGLRQSRSQQDPFGPVHLPRIDCDVPMPHILHPETPVWVQPQVRLRRVHASAGDSQAPLASQRSRGGCCRPSCMRCAAPLNRPAQTQGCRCAACQHTEHWFRQGGCGHGGSPRGCTPADGMLCARLDRPGGQGPRPLRRAPRCARC